MQRYVRKIKDFGRALLVKAGIRKQKSQFSAQVPDIFKVFSHATSFSELGNFAVKSKEVWKKPSPGSQPRWVLDFIERAKSADLGPKERAAFVSESLRDMKLAIDNADRIFQLHLSDLIYRFNLDKLAIKADKKRREMFFDRFLHKIPQTAEWREVKKHFPYPELGKSGIVYVPERRLQATLFRQNAELAPAERLAKKLSRFTGEETRPIDEHWLAMFDRTDAVANALEELKTDFAFLKMELLPEGKPVQ